MRSSVDPREAAPAAPCEHPACVLYVEDDESIRDVMSLILEDEGFRVDPCLSAEEGLERLRQRPYDVVLTDQNLPGNPGSWLLEHASQAGLLKRAAGLVLTACSGPVPVDPAFPVLRKPVEFCDLVDSIRQAVAEVRRRHAHGPELERLHKDAQLAVSLADACAECAHRVQAQGA